MAKDLFIQPGVYGEETPAPHGVKLRAAHAFELRRLSQQSQYTFFLPYIPMAICPSLPDPVAEYAYAGNRQVEVVYWPVEHQLVPSMAKKEIRTDRVFGILNPDGVNFLNFARGIVLEDVKTGYVARILINQHQLIEPAVSMSQSMERILASQFTCYSLSVQLPDKLIMLRRDEANPSKFRVVQDLSGGDRRLWHLARKIWMDDSRPLG